MSHETPFGERKIIPVFGGEFYRPSRDGDDPAPTCDAGQLLRLRVVRNRLAVHINRLSQTPLGHEDLFENGLPYDAAARQVLEARLGHATSEVGLDPGDPICDAILSEIFIEHGRRLMGNTASKERLLACLDGQEVPPEVAELLWKAKLALATPAETAALLLQFPIMGSIEAAKYTNPFDRTIALTMDAHIEACLQDLRERFVDASLIVYPREDKVLRCPRFVDTDKTDLPKNIVCIKENYAEVSDGRVTIQLVRKHSSILLPANIPLKNTTFNPLSINKIVYNAQPIAQSCYWRLKPDSTRVE